jgi:hypothetical protein
MNLKSKLLLSAGLLVAMSGSAYAQSSEYPADAQAGQCFARVLIPEVAESVAEEVIDTPERTEVKIIPATYETVDERVLIKEESTVLEVVPATYRTVTERVLVEPERTETTVVPASTETYDERVLVRPAYTTWKPGTGLFGRGGSVTSAGGVVGASGPGGSGEQSTGELLCRVEVPAEYRTVKRTRIARPESAASRVIPARYETVSKTVVDQPARTVERRIPAEYRTVKVRKLVTPAREDVIKIPATYKTLEKRVVRTAGSVQWREVLCDTNTSPAKIREIQQALNSRGFATRVDGVFGADTLRAMETFQRQNGLPVGNLTIDTVRALNVSPR